MAKRTMVPFVKWVGGKKKVLKHLEKIWPKNINTYYEPFVGGGAALFYFLPNKAVINDLNSELMNLYEVIADDTKYKRLREYLLIFEAGHYIISDFDEDKQKDIKRSPFYKKIASIDRNESGMDRTLSLEDASVELRAARLLFLNKNNYNGLYRVNQKGQYNTPSKHVPTKTFNEDNIKAVSEYLRKSVQRYNESFVDVALKAQKGDFVYFDPPYDYDKDIKGFDAYQKEGFGIEGQKSLANVCRELDSRGVKFILSNHDTELIRELYKGFTFKTIKVKRLVGGKGSERKDVNEVLVRNYE